MLDLTVGLGVLRMITLDTRAHLLAIRGRIDHAGGQKKVDPDGLVTEGASSNAWIVDKDGVLRTRDTTANILRGVTRSTLMEVIATSNLKVEERAFTPAEAAKAREETFLFLPISMSSYHIAVNKRVTGFNPRPTGDKYYFKTLGVSA